MQYTFRKCTQTDFDFLYLLKEKCLKWYIEIIYGWDEVFQKRALQKEMDKLLYYMNIIQIINTTAISMANPPLKKKK